MVSYAPKVSPVQDPLLYLWVLQNRANQEKCVKHLQCYLNLDYQPFLVYKGVKVHQEGFLFRAIKSWNYENEFYGQEYKRGAHCNFPFFQ